MASAGSLVSCQGQQLVHCSSLRTPVQPSSKVAVKPSALGFASSSLIGETQALCSSHVSRGVQQACPPGRLVVEAKGRKNPVPRTGQSGGTAVHMAPRIPDLDPSDKPPYFTIFIRGKAKRGRPWLPLTMVAGGSTATPLLQLMSSPFGRKLYLSTLTRNMASSVSKDGAIMVNKAKEVYPELQDDNEYEFGYKMLDKANPKNGFNTSDVIVAPHSVEHEPPRAELGQQSRRDFLTQMGWGGAGALALAAALVGEPLVRPLPSWALPKPDVGPEVLSYFKTSSGVKVQDIVEGSGPEAGPGATVRFNLVCRRSNGYFVFSTVDPFTGVEEPAEFPLGQGQVIVGLEEVLFGMRPGGKRRALIPPEVGYVSRDLQPQPTEFGPNRALFAHAKEPLVFEVQLLKVK